VNNLDKVRQVFRTPLAPFDNPNDTELRGLA
jgi:hypothetical protein